MEIKLSETIRSFRKARSLTQEQLAEALGVTAGAVYKWEAGLSTPDIELIVSLADLFDTSVDVLLGYDIKSHKKSAVVARLRELMHNRDDRALAEADSALTRYPNCFDIVYCGATLYHMFGLIKRDNKLLRRAIELMERSILLIDQNTDPEVSVLSLNIGLADLYFEISEAERAVELLKRNNPCGINNALIGYSLASKCERPEEAVPYLSKALLNDIASFSRIVMGYINVYVHRKDFASAREILRIALHFFQQFKEPGKPCFLDRGMIMLSVCLAEMHIQLNDSDTARDALRTAKRIAEEFDMDPNYEADSIRFVSGSERMTAFDDMGGSAKEGIINLINDLESEPLTALWEEINCE